MVFICLPFDALCLEKMTNEDLSTISGKAVTDNPAFNQPDIVFPTDSIDQFLTSFSQSNTPSGSSDSFKTVAVDFYGKQTIDAFGNTYHENFYVTTSVDTVYYENTPYKINNRDGYASDLYTQFVFDGIMNAKVDVPEYFDNNPDIKTKQITISQDRIDLPSGSTGHYICSYQGNIYEAGHIPETDTSFSVFPNRQTITVGTAEGDDLMVLLPRGTGLETVWRPVVKTTNPLTSETEYLVIPEGRKFIHIGLNHMISRIDMNFTLRFSHSEKQLKDISKEILDPADIGQTLGTFTMTGGETRINGGDVIITINDRL